MREKIDKLPDNLSARGLKKVDQEKKYIYESPDGGKTIYRRLMDSDLSKVKDKSIQLHEEVIEGMKLKLDKLEKIIGDIKRKLN